MEMLFVVIVCAKFITDLFNEKETRINTTLGSKINTKRLTVAKRLRPVVMPTSLDALGTIAVTVIIIIIIIYPLNARVVVTPQVISQPVSSIFPYFPLPYETWRTPGLSILSSSVCLVFFPLSLCLARWFWPFGQNTLPLS